MLPYDFTFLVLRSASGPAILELQDPTLLELPGPTNLQLQDPSHFYQVFLRSRGVLVFWCQVLLPLCEALVLWNLVLLLLLFIALIFWCVVLLRLCIVIS